MLRRRRRYNNSISDKKELGIDLRHPPAPTAYYSTQLLEVDDVKSKWE